MNFLRLWLKVLPLLLFCSCMPYFGPTLKTISKATDAKDTEKLSKLLSHTKSSYIREYAAKALRDFPVPDADKKKLTPLLISCLKNSKDADYVQAQCALTLAKFGHVEAVEIIIEKMKDFDDESRYWAVEALTIFAKTNRAAKTELTELTSDPDMLIAAKARIFLEKGQ